jgi:uncharacterized protein YlxW (UPF0749 family)
MRVVVLLCALGASSAGCSKFAQAKECGQLAKVTNAFVAESTKHKPTQSSDPVVIAKENRETAARYERLANDLSELHIKSLELGKHVTAYRDIATQAAVMLKDVASAVENGNFELARQKRVDFDGIAKSEAPLVAQINSTCR